MTLNKQKIHILLKGIETGDPDAALVVNKQVYVQLHRVLAQDNFVLSIGEGFWDGEHSAFYDLFRVDDNKLVEHWDTIEQIPPISEWKNNNGKF
ncbi:MAG: putative SnoaL-like aldol condensation-catalyzing enzyme [Alphaproteobacteria bacterium]|jgi:predicted SnoaL-like aldol condensation-catalyzing enzyme